ncbi:hypothetical protein [Marinomonas ostreistagni]|uniref:hypothetical protein n=1 Tax=Marinomonas ostreistagni TaxID=359209 RepID=UPI00194E699E|nr:hypothetical protein [Marinomonas ostreistagni]MBM6551022.1 hypothetical protein [Marinomonas ostreistagni]
MSRELTPHHAFQTDCLEQMGIVSWVQGQAPATGTIYRAPQPWPRADGLQASEPDVIMDDSAFAPPMPAPARAPEKIDPEQKDASVADLKRQLGAAPEVIVEDLQPIEEVVLDTPELAPDAGQKLPLQTHLAGYFMLGRLLVLSDLPQAFNDEDALDKLALNLSKALLKQEVSEWHKGLFRWPGRLQNQYLVGRQDWLLGAFEQFLMNQLGNQANQELLIILAGQHSVQFFDALPDAHPLKRHPAAQVDSLPQMLRIPELRKDAWATMQSTFFAPK